MLCNLSQTWKLVKLSDFLLFNSFFLVLNCDFKNTKYYAKGDHSEASQTSITHCAGHGTEPNDTPHKDAGARHLQRWMRHQGASKARWMIWFLLTDCFWCFRNSCHTQRRTKFFLWLTYRYSTEITNGERRHANQINSISSPNLYLFN